MSSPAPVAQVAPSTSSGKGETKSEEKEKGKDTRRSNIAAAKAVADAVRTSLGPRGMDKMIVSPTNEVVITNDGATILKHFEVIHPCAKMLVDLSAAQDTEAGDGTTTVTIMAGALLGAVQKLMSQGIHPSVISESFMKAATKAEEILQSISTPVDFKNRETLLASSNTSLNSKVVGQYSNILSPIAVDSVLHVVDPTKEFDLDLNNIKIVKKLGGTIEDTKLIDGLVFSQSSETTGQHKVENAKIGLIQFCLSPPKTNMESNVIINDYQQMDRILREERNYILNICKKIQKTGCNVLLIQKSILRDAVTEMSVHYLNKMKIVVIKDIERDQIEFISKTIGATPIASIDTFTADKLGTAKLVEEESTPDGKVTFMTGVPNIGKTVSVLIRGSNHLVLDEAERSLHDALCVIRCLIKKRAIIVGGAAPEIELSMNLGRWAKTLQGREATCIAAYAEAFEVIPYTLAENAGLHPIAVVTELRNRHEKGEKLYGISVKKGTVANMMEENVIQPLLVSSSAVRLSTETVALILKIDDVVLTR